MTCTRNHTVRIVTLNHHNSEGQGVAKKCLSCFLHGHTLGLTKLIERLYIIIQSVCGVRVDNCYTVKFNIEPDGTVENLLLITYQNNICDSLSDNMTCCNKCSLVSSLRKHDSLDIGSRFLFNLINILSHGIPPFAFSAYLQYIIIEQSITVQG